MFLRSASPGYFSTLQIFEGELIEVVELSVIKQCRVFKDALT